MLTFLAGVGLGLSLIVAIGAQNVFVLRQGLRREHVLTVVLICATSDAALIVAGVVGLGALVQAAPWLISIARWAGALFLLGYGLLAARRAWKGAETGLRTIDAVGGPSETSTSVEGKGTVGRKAGSTADAASRRLAPVVFSALALTWLNPHVYLDTVLLLGSVAATYGDARWTFAIGAITASFSWFFSLGFGARYFGTWLRTPRSWRILDAAIAAIMVLLAISLVLPLF